MEFEGTLKDISVSYDKERKTQIVFESTDINNSMLDEYLELKDKKLNIKCDVKREKRSLNSNAYMWVLLQKMAEKLNTTKDELYLEELKKYSRCFTHIIVKPSAVEEFKKEFKTCIELGEVTVNGQTGIQLQCYYGTSTMNSEEMQVLLKGIVEDCNDLGIETISPENLVIMNSAWGK